MESYIDKLASDYKRTDAVAHYHPMDLQALKLKLRPMDDRAPFQLLQRYQSLIGNLRYPASQLRTDIAFCRVWDRTDVKGEEGRSIDGAT
jgi:hypothetical protein